MSSEHLKPFSVAEIEQLSLEISQLKQREAEFAAQEALTEGPAEQQDLCMPCWGMGPHTVQMLTEASAESTWF